MSPTWLFLVKSCTILDSKTDSYILSNNLMADTLIPVYQYPVTSYFKRGEEHRKGNFVRLLYFNFPL